ncbi:MAG: thiamine-phosphate kinase [Deltaproteobacteria bacterium]
MTLDTLKDIGEFGLIGRIDDLLKREGVQAPGVSLGIGDDTASFKARPGYEVLVTCDCVVEGRHFLSRHISSMNLGRRSMMLNISDIGAMGGHPLYALISLGLKNETLVKDIKDLYRGFLAELNPFGASIIGGNLTKSGNGIFIDITLIGEVEEGKAVARSGAKPGDVILVTGYPGQSAAGLQLLLQSLASVDHPLVQAYNNPSHRAREGRAVALTGCASAMIDTSDGFLGDLGHICEKSRVGALLSQDTFPMSAELREAAKLLKREPYEFFIGDSDDYQLIITCRSKDVEAVRLAVGATYKGPVTEVGRLTAPEEGIRVVLADGSERMLSAKGWDHFR